MSRYYDRAGNQIDVNQWIALSSEEYKRVALSEGVVPGVVVSTVWLGLDLGYGDGPPFIFETMVFGGAHDEEQERYSTEADALAGHARWVDAAKNAAPGEEWRHEQ